jgi:putative transposase
VRTGKKVFFHEDLNLKGLSKRNQAKPTPNPPPTPSQEGGGGGFDAAFGNFFKTLDYIAAKAGAVVIPQKPAYSSMILCYRNEAIFTDINIRNYWDEKESLMVDRDVNAAINLKRLGLGIFPSIKRRSGKIDIVGTMSDSTTKEILNTLIGL